MKDKEFERLLRQKINGLETPPPAEWWDGIEASLQQRVGNGRPRTAYLRRWGWTLSAAAVATVAFMLTFLRHTDERAAVTELPAVASDVAQHPAAAGERVMAMGGGPAAAASDPGAPVHTYTKKGVATTATEYADGREVKATPGGNDGTEAASDAGNGALGSESGEYGTENAKELNGTAGQPAAKQATPVRQPANPRAMKRQERRPEPAQRLQATAVGGEHGGSRRGITADVFVTGHTAGRQSNNAPVQFLYSSEVQQPDVEPNATPLLKTEAASNVHAKHLPPFAVGIDFRFPIAPRFALETGVAYSILASKFSQSLPSSVTHQQAHFVGIPLRAVVDVFTHSPWNVYVAAGGKWEQCVAVHTDGAGNPAAEGVRPTQWSLQVAAGIGYNLSRNAAFYLEPGVGYYFDSDTPLRTAYQERSTNFSLKMGLRFGIGGKRH